MLKNSICRLSTQCLDAQRTLHIIVLVPLSHNILGYHNRSHSSSPARTRADLAQVVVSCDHHHPSAGSTQLCLPCRAEAFLRFIASDFPQGPNDHCLGWQEAGRTASSPIVLLGLVVIGIRHGVRSRYGAAGLLRLDPPPLSLPSTWSLRCAAPVRPSSRSGAVLALARAGLMSIASVASGPWYPGSCPTDAAAGWVPFASDSPGAQG